ncbi:hypothetical protein, partial [Runella sp.]|uniref:hypothetical protein n=2 Tax=Runella sp. TaxID=1960881 RepID=UPI002634C20C
PSQRHQSPCLLPENGLTIFGIPFFGILQLFVPISYVPIYIANHYFFCNYNSTGKPWKFGETNAENAGLIVDIFAHSLVLKQKGAKD